MALVEERPDSRERNGETATLRYTIRQTSSDAVALAALLANVPSTYNGQPRKDGEVTVEAEFVDTVNDQGIWRGEVPYGPAETENEVPLNQWSFSFSTTGGTQHITQALATVSSYAPSGQTAPNFHGAIGVTSNGVEGVDIGAPVMNFTGRCYVAENAMNGDYIVGLYRLSKKTNDATWTAQIDGVGVQFAAGEVLFEGATSISKRDDGIWEVVGEFSASPNKTGLSVGSITGIAKKGWEYLWVYYSEQEDTSAHRIVKVPIAAYVERVYEEGDFGDLVL